MQTLHLFARQGSRSTFCNGISPPVAVLGAACCRGTKAAVLMASLTEKARASAEAVSQRAKHALEHLSSSFTPAVNKIEGGNKMFILAVLPKGGVAAKNPEYLDCVEHALGLGDWVKQHGATLVATDDKERPNSDFDKLLPQTDILITTPFHPAYVTRERLEKANKLNLIITAGVGSDHIDLHAAADHNLTVAEITGHEQIKMGEWDVCAATADAYDFKNKVVGTVGAGHIGQEYMRRVQKGWDAKELLYYGRHEKKPIEELGVKFEPNFDAFLGKCDVVVVNVPLTDKTRGMFNSETIGKMKRGAVLVNCARGAICDTNAVVKACDSGYLKGYAGDVWPKQPEAFPEEYYIVREGKLAEQYT